MDAPTPTVAFRARRTALRTMPFVAVGFTVGGMHGLARRGPGSTLPVASAVAFNFGAAAFTCFGLREGLEVAYGARALDEDKSLVMSALAGILGGSALGTSFAAAKMGSAWSGFKGSGATGLMFGGVAVAMHYTSGIVEKWWRIRRETIR